MGTMSGNQMPESNEQLRLAGRPENHTPKRLQIVGFKNSGKTTLTEALLRRALELGWITSAIKRHGHGGTPDLPPAGTDASRFFEAGAASSIVSGGGMMLLQGRQEPEKAEDLDPLIRLTETQAAPDLILIEGFKEASHPKIVLVRSVKDWMQLSRLMNIVLVVTAHADLAKQLIGESEGTSSNDGTASDINLLRGSAAIHVFPREQTQHISAWFTDWLKGENHESL